MKRAYKSHWIFCLICGLFTISAAAAQDTTITPAPEIKVTAFFDQKQVPLNRHILLTIRIMWQGDVRRYEIENFENPGLHNLEIDTTGTSNRVSEYDGVQYFVTEFYYSIKPISMGMGYVDNMTIWYRDRLTQERASLATRRMEVKTIEPVPEPGDKKWLWQLALAILILAVAGIGGLLYRNKKIAARKAAAAAEQAVPIEEKYLEQLHTLVNLNKADLDLQDCFLKLSRLMRRYLFERYPGAAPDLTTEGVIEALETGNAAEELIRNAREVLTTCDVAKFSGTANKADLDRVYTLIEVVFMSPKARSDVHTPTVEDKNTENAVG